MQPGSRRVRFPPPRPCSCHPMARRRTLLSTPNQSQHPRLLNLGDMHANTLCKPCPKTHAVPHFEHTLSSRGDRAGAARGVVVALTLRREARVGAAAACAMNTIKRNGCQGRGRGRGLVLLANFVVYGTLHQRVLRRCYDETPSHLTPASIS